MLKVYLSLTFVATAWGSLPYTDTYYLTTATSSTGKSFSISATDSFSSCTCDLTKGGCDNACCCDSDCDSATVSQWRLLKNFCLDELNDQKILNMNQCLDRTLTGGISDLQDGLKVYGKNIRSLFCVTSKSSRDTVSSFVTTQFSPSDAAQFNETLTSRQQKTITTTTNSDGSTDTNSGYSTYEELKGYRVIGSKNVYNSDQKLYLYRKDLFGQCGRGKPIKFQQDQDTDECGYFAQPITADFCTNQLSPLTQALNLQVSVDGVSTTYAPLVPGVQKKFSLNTNKEVTLKDTSVFYDSSFDKATCTCSSMLLEAHYTVYYSDFNSSYNIQNQIDNITVDVIYGDFTPDSCLSLVSMTKKTSIQFKQSLYSRKNSGGPGYIKGNQILIGTNATATEGTYVVQSQQGFFFRGADNEGNCYNIKTSLSSGLNTTDYLIVTPDEKLYYDDPQFVFQDSTIYGCKHQLTRDELQDFCQNKRWQNIMLFQNIQLLEYVGRFGNSNPHFLSDWIEVTIDSTKDKSDITVEWDNNAGSCGFPSSYFLQVFYSKINTQSDPQYEIIKVQHYADTLNAWVYKKPDPTQKQDFQAILSIQFYELDQEADFYAPKTPNPIKALPRNVLYPFYVYGANTASQVYLAFSAVALTLVYQLL